MEVEPNSNRLFPKLRLIVGVALVLVGLYLTNRRPPPPPDPAPQVAPDSRPDLTPK